ncbi:MAG: response regulator [Nitrospirota bacterium]
MSVVETPLSLLVADDERASRELLQKALSRPDRRLTLARDGNAAVEILDRELFDVVVTDLNMPGINGIEVFHYAVGSNRDTQVIFITGYGSLEMVVGAIEEGAYDFVTKPFKLAQIQLVVRNACDKVRLMKEVQQLRQHVVSERGTVGTGNGDGRASEVVAGAVGRGNAGLIGEYARAAQGSWLQADARLALERLRSGGEISAEEFALLEGRLKKGTGK